MANLKDLSDSELNSMIAQKQSGGLSSIPDEELDMMIAKKQRAIPFNQAEKAPVASAAGMTGLLAGSDRSLAGAFDDLITRPSIDLARGARKGAADVVSPAASVLEFMGAENNIFSQMRDANLQEAESLPNSGLPTLKDNWFPAQGAYEMLGRTPGITAEFLQGGAILKGAKVAKGAAKLLGLPEKGGAVAQLTGSSELALVSALEELKEGVPAAAQAGLESATIGLGIPVSAALYGKARELGQRYGVPVAKKLLGIAGVPQETADAFIKNPNKFVLSPFKKQEKSLREVKEINTVRKDRLEAAHDRKKDLMAQRHKSELQATQDKYNEVLSDLKDYTINVDKKLNINSLKDEMLQKRQNVINAANEKLNTHAMHTIAVAKETRKSLGGKVGSAIDDMIHEKPFTSVDSKTVLGEFDKVLRDRLSPVTVGIGKDSIVKAKNPANKAIAEKINEQREILKGYMQSGKVTVSALQEMKSVLQELGLQKNPVSKTREETLYGFLSDSVNIVRLAEKHKGISRELGDDFIKSLSKANKDFSNYVKTQDAAFSNIAKKTKNGLVPDIPKMVNGVKRKDQDVINSIKALDATLPQGNKMLPNIEEHIAKEVKFKQHERDAVNALTKRLDNEIAQITKNQKAMINKKVTEKTLAKRELERKQKQEYINYTNRRKKQIQEQKRLIKEQEQFIEDRELLQGQDQLGFRAITGMTAPLSAGALRFIIGSDINVRKVLDGVNSQTGKRLLNEAIRGRGNDR